MGFSSVVAAVAAVLGFGSATTTPPAIPQQPCVTIVRTLAVGSTGADVIALQNFLSIKATGYYGPMTQTAVIKWQKANKLITTSQSAGAGQIGPKTRAAMKCKKTSDTSAIEKISVSINPPIATTSSVTIPPVAPLPQLSSGGGAGPSASQCAPFMKPMPPASQCQTGEWVRIDDEAGCPTDWDCQDPNSAQ